MRAADPCTSADPTQVTGQAPVDDKAAAAVDSTTTSGKSDEPAAPAPEPTPAPAVAPTPTTNESETSKVSSESGKPKIGSAGWFKTAIPIGKRKEEDTATHTEPQATAGAGGAEEVKDTSSPLPPNHLGENVPAGQVDTAAINESVPTETSGPSATSPHGEAAMHDTTPAPGTNYPQATETDRDAQRAAEQPQKYAEEAGPSQEKSSSGGMFSNPFSSSDKKIENEAPLEKRRLSREAKGSNPNAIPTAGGVRIGSVAYERRKSVDPRRSASINQPIPDEDEDEDVPAATSADAAGAASTSNVPSSPPAPEIRAETPTESSAPSASTAPTSLDTKTDEAPPRTSMSPSEGKEHRKRSIFGKVKEKLHH